MQGVAVSSVSLLLFQATHIALPRKPAGAVHEAASGKALTRPSADRGKRTEKTPPPAASPSAVHPGSSVAAALLPLSELHDMLVAAVVPSTKVVADLFPLPLRVIPRGAKRPAPAPLRCASPSVWPGLGQLQGDHHCNANKENSNDHELHQIHQRRHRNR